MPANRSSITPDVIVVGAGTAGCVVAANLAAAGVGVELIEAGPATDPSAAARSVDWLPIQHDPARRWTDLLVDRDGSGPEPYVVGRGVGGGSAINGMVVSPSSAALVESLSLAVPGLADAMARVTARWTTVSASPAPFGTRLIGASHDAGLRAGPVELALATSGDGMLHRHLLATGLQSVSVLTGTAVRRCVFGGGKDRGPGLGQVTGVELADGTVRSAGRVILCAGAIHTPAILLRSGVGSRNPHIGVGLADHPSRVITVELGPELHAPPGALSPITARLRPTDDPGVEVLVMDHTGGSTNGRRIGAVIVMVLDPVSTGSVRLARESSELGAKAGGLDTEPIRVELGLLSDPADRRRLDNAVARTRRLLADAIGHEGELQPGFGPVSHVAASCRFGSAVSEAGEVVGLDGVSVMDASVFPSVPAAHPMLPTIALAEAFSAEWLRRAGIGNHPHQ